MKHEPHKGLGISECCIAALQEHLGKIAANPECTGVSVTVLLNDNTSTTFAIGALSDAERWVVTHVVSVQSVLEQASPEKQDAIASALVGLDGISVTDYGVSNKEIN